MRSGRRGKRQACAGPEGPLAGQAGNRDKAQCITLCVPQGAEQQGLTWEEMESGQGWVPGRALLRAGAAVARRVEAAQN